MPLNTVSRTDMYIQPFGSYKTLKFIDFCSYRYMEHFTVNCTRSKDTLLLQLLGIFNLYMQQLRHEILSMSIMCL